MMFFFFIFCLCCACFVIPSVALVYDGVKTMLTPNYELNGAILELLFGVGGLFVGFGMFFANYANFFPNIY